MGRLIVKGDYEELRKAQILENQARLASLGLQKIIGELRTKSQSEKKKYNKVDYFSAPLRRSNRLKGHSAPSPIKVLSPEAPAQRSNPLKVGVRCHFCRQKELCGEEDCKRCGDLDMDQPCLEMEDVRANKEWICPHCTEEKGINPYWICNSSLCLKKRKMAPTGNAIFRARQMGYKSVAHLLMDQLQGAMKGR